MLINILSGLLIAFPFILVSGTLLTNLSMTAIGIYYLASLHKYEAREFLNHFLVKLIFIFWIYLIFSSLLSINITSSLESSLFFGRFILFSLGTAFLITQNKKIILYFGYSLWACLIILTIDGYLQFFTGKNILGWEKFDELRISSFFGDELILGNFMARLMPLAFFFIYFIKYKNKLPIIILGLIVLTLVDVLIFLSGERTAFFLLILGSVMIVLLVPNFRVIRAITFLISCFLILLITTQFEDVKERMVDQTINDFGLSEVEQNLIIFSQGHQDHYKIALSMFIEKPIIGHGPKMFRFMCSEYNIDSIGCSTHPHNSYLQLLAETGIIGFLPVIGIFIYIIFALSRHFFFYLLGKNQFILKNETIFLFICFTITLGPFAPSFNFFTSWINAVYYLPIGFYLYQSHKQ